MTSAVTLDAVFVVGVWTECRSHDFGWHVLKSNYQSRVTFL